MTAIDTQWNGFFTHTLYFPLSLRTLRIVPTTSRMRELVGTF